LQCDGEHCSDVHLEAMVNLDLGWNINMEAARSLNIDIFVDVAYCYEEEQCYDNPSVSYAGLLSFYNLAEVLQLNAAMITIDVRGTSFLEVIDQYQRLAIAVGDKPNVDLVNHCHEMHAAMEAMIPVARKMETDGIRVTTGYIGHPGYPYIFLAQPTDDPVTLMLEQLGVPMTHVNVNDQRGGYWEWMDFPDADSVWRSANKDQVYTVKGLYPTDVWLYDKRRHEAHMADEFKGFNDPAWVAGQRAVWPIDTTYTYERATRILNSLRHAFSNAKRIATPSTCTPVDVTAHARLGGGQWACHNPKPTFPSCPSATPDSETPSSPGNNDNNTMLSSSDSDGMESGAVAGLAVGMLVVGCLLGAAVGYMTGQSRKTLVRGTTTSIQKP
jgi:hypothetical protein